MGIQEVRRFRPLLDIIARNEGTGDQPVDGYNTSLGFGIFTGGEQNLVAMSLAAINALQIKMLQHPRNNLNSSALGRYQIVRRTLLDLRRQLQLGDTLLFSAALQDDLACALIRRRGRNARGLRLEWASLARVSERDILAGFDTDGTAIEAPADLVRDLTRDVFGGTTGGSRDAGDMGPADTGSNDATATTGGTAPDAAPSNDRGGAAEPTPTGLTYRVARIASGDDDALAEALNGFAAAGWTVVEIVPSKSQFLVVLSRSLAAAATAPGDDDDDEPDETVEPGVVAEFNEHLRGGIEADDVFGPTTGLTGDALYKRDFFEFIGRLNLVHFDAEEFLALGGQHFSGRCKGKNGFPPRSLWPNIVETAKVLDDLREKLGSPVRTNSVYRTPAYNDCLSGTAANSFHMKFNAVDFQCEDGNPPTHWAKVLKGMRDAGRFKGGIGVYGTFVHVDTRGFNAHWGPKMRAVFG